MAPAPSRRPEAGAPSTASGTAAAGAANKEENIYIPSFISKKPFYAAESDDDNDYLKHQRREAKKESTKWYDRGKKAGPAATKYRKGACENCGAMTHKAKDCLSRPRAKGAKWTGKDIQADEVIEDVDLGWDAKRDRWNGYNAKEYRNVIAEFNQMEELRKKSQKSQTGEEGDGEENDNDGDKYAEENDMSKHQSTATRQLRIREDTAKYLLNLDLESAKYDPKTRSLVDRGATGGKAAELYAEEGFMRSSGEAGEFEKVQRYAWEAQEKAGDTSKHPQANPTAGAFFRRKEQEEAEQRKAKRDKELEEKYGGHDQIPMPAAVRSIMVPDSEVFAEYDETGLIKGAPRKAARSKYAEDVLINNHSSVWGSWWSNFKWGYACCHSVIKNSYCTGEEGKEAWEAAERQRTGADLDLVVAKAQGGDREKEEGEEAVGEVGSGEHHEVDKIGKAAAAKTGVEAGTRKRTVGDMLNGVTEEELDSWRRKRAAADDPMSKFLGKDALLS